MTSGKRRRALGKGLDALIGGGVREADDEVEPTSGDVVITSQVTTDKVTTDKLVVADDVLERAVEEGLKNSRVVVWSPRASVVLRVLRKTVPEFSISEVAADLLEEGLRRKYPDVWALVEGRVPERKRKR